MPDLASEWLTVSPAASRSSKSEGAPVAPDLASEWITAEPAKTTQRVGTDHPLAEVARLIAQNPEETWKGRAIRTGAGMLRGLGDVSDTLAQGIAATGRGGANALQTVGAISPESVQKVTDWSDRVNRDIRDDRLLFDENAKDFPTAQGGRIGGQILGTLPAAGAGAAGTVLGLAGRPIVNALVSGAALGGTSAALTSASSDASLGEQVLTGAVAGGLVGPAGYAASRAGRGLRNALLGEVDPATARLALDARTTYGIPVTAGQISPTPLVRFTDSVLQRLPFSGYGARTAEQGSAFNREVARTFGEHTDAITTNTIRDAKARIGPMFDSVARRTGQVQADAALGNDLTRIMTDAQSVLPRSEMGPLTNQLRNIIDVVDPATRALSADSYLALTRRGAPLDRAQKSADPNMKYYANQIREALDDALQRSAPPNVVADLITARSQWRAMKTIEPLADKASPSGISPALLMGAVNKGYPGSRGGAELRDLGQIGQRFIKEPPSSGTSERLLAMHGLGLAGGALGLGGAYYFDPEATQKALAIGGSALAAGRLGSSALRSNWLANTMINSPLPPNINALAISRRLSPATALALRDRSSGQ